MVLHVLLHRSFKMAVGFGGVGQYVGWMINLIFMYIVTSKIRFDVLLGEVGGFMKNVAVTFSVQNSAYEGPLIERRLYNIPHCSDLML